MKGYHRRIALAGAIALSGLTLGAAPASADFVAQACDFPRNISIGDAKTYEGTGAGSTNLVFTVDGRGGCPYGATVHYQVVAGSAGLTDFTASTGTLSWAYGDTTLRKISVPINRDALDEANETLSVALTPAAGWIQMDDNIGTGTIRDDDGTPTWNIDGATCGEGDSGTHECGFTISLSNAQQNGAPPTVKVSASNGTAVATDYVPFVDKLVTLPLGQQAVTAKLVIKGDDLCEANETVKLTLSAPSAGTKLAVEAQAIATIEEDDYFC